MVFWLHTARAGSPDTLQTHPRASDFHDYHSDTPKHPPDIPKTPPSYLQGTQYANRQQQTPTDTTRHTQTAPISDFWSLTLAVSVGVCCCLLACYVPWGCPGGVWGMSVWCFGASEWYSFKSEALGCVWGLSGFSLLSPCSMEPKY